MALYNSILIKKKKKVFEMRSCIIFQAATPAGVVLEDYIWWRDLDLTKICPFCISGAVTVDLSPDGTWALSARASEAAQSHGRGPGHDLRIKSGGWWVV